MRSQSSCACRLVEDGRITPDDFRAFTFTNAVKLWGTQNPKFFEPRGGQNPSRPCEKSC